MSKRKHTNVPSYRDLLMPCYAAIDDLGGSGSIAEINDRAIALASLTPEILAVSHDGGVLTEVEYQLAWSRTILKRAGLITNSGRGVWRILNADLRPEMLESKWILTAARTGRPPKARSGNDVVGPDEGSDCDLQEYSEHSWKESLLGLLRSMHHSSFERLAQRILRESGFSHVEVLGKSGDGGIDGLGILKIQGVLSFYVLFQCKKYAGAVSSSEVRDFRGAMQGRSDKGLIITTGSFTRDARLESKRDGAPPIELIDGNALCDLMKTLGIGLRVELVERVQIEHEYFNHV